MSPGMSTSSHHLAALTVCGLLAACVQPSAPSKDDSPVKRSDKPAPPTTPPVQPPATASPRAYVSIDGVGLHVLDEKGWRLELETRAPIRDMLQFNGQLFVLSAFGVQQAAQGQAQTVAKIERDIYSQIGDPLALASGDGLEFWVAGPLGVAHYTGSWQLTPVAASNPTNVDVALDRTGVPYLLFGSLFRQQGGSWQAHADASITTALALLPDPRNDAMLVHGGCQADLRTCVVLRASVDAPAARIELAADECTDYDQIAMSPDATKAVIAGRCGLVRFELVGEPKPVRLGLDAGWPGQPLRSLGLDARGRVWAGSNNSVTIIAADGKIDDYPIAQLGDIAGAVGPLIVEGDGPPPPTLGRERKGNLTGVIVVLEGETKKPLPGVALELCSRLAPAGELPPDPKRSPCAGVPTTHATTTDGEGKFELTSVPIGDYYFGAEIDGQWARGKAKSLTMRAGMNGNVGKVTVIVPK
jgi:hypothetical protein